MGLIKKRSLPLTLHVRFKTQLFPALKIPQAAQDPNLHQEENPPQALNQKKDFTFPDLQELQHWLTNVSYQDKKITQVYTI